MRTKQHIYAENQIERFVSYVKKIMTVDRLERFKELSIAEKLVFYIVYSTSKFETESMFDNLISYLKKYGNAEYDREIYALIDYMIDQRKHNKRFEEMNMATLQAANRVYTSRAA
ncbi:hypothetical protein [Rickettsiales endosymbiont of Stachyamoeba lipophora]|uniref:hypothetical protein n=1 Tax=Rickettsiales endosymbiont of Stachyamoeba lipophora TaxID=2486578 RepID=UPI000F64F96E|nr:hypothetical protein [Rickettsiales endosymbiont of Stachyamoeba lipophora]AZL15411.1 hypothetical protein EF513_02430 [Rickettsiales endosymbiont of Stachyamoeba lipophora]